MKKFSPPLLRTLLIGASAMTVVSAQAQTTFIKANNNTSLNLAPSYTANSTVPGVNDTIQVDTSWTGALGNPALGGNLSINALTYNATSTFQVGATTNATLTIGAGGISKNGGASLIFNNAITLGANQTWTLTAGTNNLQVNGAFNDGGRTLNITGNGTLDLRGSNTFGSNVTIANTQINVNSANATVVLGGTNTFDAVLINNGKLSGSTIGNYGVASNFGDGGTNSTITMGGSNANGTFSYTGNTVSTNRTFTRDLRSTGSGIEVTTAGQTLTITGNLLSSGTPTAATSWNFSGDGNLTLNGVVASGNATFAQGIAKSGSGTLTLNAANTFAGGTTVTAGTLLLSSTGTVANTNNVTISGGAVELGASERINNSANMTLSGGTLRTGGFSETLGTLTLSNSTTSFLDFGSGTSTLLFAGISTGTGILAITNWTFGSDSLRFTSNTNLSFTSFTVNGGGAAIINQGAYYEVVPEPSTWALLAMGVMTIFFLHRRRRAKA